MALNGYDQTWTGTPQGSGQFHVEVRNADGSPLSRPLTIDGAGEVLRQPPLGKFGPEQFWINTGKCTYALYTSSALNTTSSRDAPRVDGVSVHVEGIPIPSNATNLSGNKSFALPHANNYYGGDQFFFPCILIDWCNRGQGTGTISWSFAPDESPPTESSAAPATKAIRCPKWDALTASRPSRLRSDLAAAFKRHADAVVYRDVSVTANEVGAPAKLEVRLGRDDRALPSLECVNEAIANGSAGPQSQAGAQRLLLGAIQQGDGNTRVTMRIVDVETGRVLQSGLGDATGVGDTAIADASFAALQQLGTHFR